MNAAGATFWMGLNIRLGEEIGARVELSYLMAFVRSLPLGWTPSLST